MKSTLKNAKLFFGQFVAGERIGSVMPSSKSLALKMIRGVDFENAKTIVELGPGTGAITKHIIRRMSPDTQLISIELNDKFVKQLAQTYPQRNVIFVHDSVESIPQILEGMGVSEVDAFISSLPISLFPESMVEKLTVDMSDALSESGVYIQYQYSLHKRKWIESNWNVIRKAITVVNVPPSIIYTCRKLA